MNTIIINNFQNLIKLLQYEYDNNNDKTLFYKLKSLKKSLSIIKTLKFNITKNNLSYLKSLPGIGKGTISRIEEILNSNTLQELSDLQIKYDKYIKLEPIIESLSSLIGIGRKIAVKLINEYNLTSLNDLQNLLKTNKDIPYHDKLTLGLKYIGKFKGNIPRSEIDKIYKLVSSLIYSKYPDLELVICGSYRREKKTSSDIDILITNLSMNEIKLKNIIDYLHDNKFITDHITYSNIETKYMGFCRLNDKSYIRRIDIRLIPIESFYTALLYFTGSFEFNIKIRNIAKTFNYKLSEYDLLDENNNPFLITSEYDIFKILKMDYVDPSKR